MIFIPIVLVAATIFWIEFLGWKRYLYLNVGVFVSLLLVVAADADSRVDVMARCLVFFIAGWVLLDIHLSRLRQSKRGREVELAVNQHQSRRLYPYPPLSHLASAHAAMRVQRMDDPRKPQRARGGRPWQSNIAADRAK